MKTNLEDSIFINFFNIHNYEFKKRTEVKVKRCTYVWIYSKQKYIEKMNKNFREVLHYFQNNNLKNNPFSKPYSIYLSKRNIPVSEKKPPPINRGIAEEFDDDRATIGSVIVSWDFLELLTDFSYCVVFTHVFSYEPN